MCESHDAFTRPWPGLQWMFIAAHFGTDWLFRFTSASPWTSGSALKPVSNVLASSLDVRSASIHQLFTGFELQVSVMAEPMQG